MKSKYDEEMIDGLTEITDDELEELFGGGTGRVYTVSLECAHQQTWQWPPVVLPK